MDKYTEQLIQDLTNKWSPPTAQCNTELEIRFAIKRDIFEQVYKYMKSNPQFKQPVLECSANVISTTYDRSENANSKNVTTTCIRKIVFENGAKLPAENYIKTRLTNPIQISDYLNYTISLSAETKDAIFATNTSATVRFKARVSFDYIVLDNDGKPLSSVWRFDLTAVKMSSLQSLGSNIGDVRKEYFGDTMNAQNLLDVLPFDMVDSFELEIEYIGIEKPQLVDFSVIKTVFQIINPQYITELAYQDEIYHCALQIYGPEIAKSYRSSSSRLKKLTNQVEALSKNTYYQTVYPPVGYYVTDKADGKRAVISINGNRLRILTSDGLVEIINGPHVVGEITICDVELFSKIENANTHYTILVFDVMTCQNNNVSNFGFHTRLESLEKCATVLRNLLGDNGTVIVKQYTKIEKDTICSAIQKAYTQNQNYKVEGIILTSANESYKQTKNYKWKPYSENTIDFLAIQCPQKMLGIKPYETIPDYTLYLLFVGISYTMQQKIGLGTIHNYYSIFPKTNESYFPIQFSPSLHPTCYLYYHPTQSESINNQIVELSRNDQNTGWVFHRIRTDRVLEKNYYGNDFRTAELTYINYIDRFDIESLWKSGNSYFVKNASDIYLSSNKLKRFVISDLLYKYYSKAKWIVDEAAGRGADLHRYSEIGVENALFMDIDPSAISELIRRRFEYNHRSIKGGNDVVSVFTGYEQYNNVDYNKIISKKSHSMSIHTLVTDLKTPYQTLIANVYRFGLQPNTVNGIVCNFAMHYMCDSIDHIKNILYYNATLLQIDGVFSFTVMDGEKVFALLQSYKPQSQWELVENNIVKYAIRKEYSGTTLADCGQSISVLLPFANEMYSEPLCNIKTIVREAKKLGFKLEVSSSMSSKLDEFKIANIELYNGLTAADKEYIELHQYVVLRKTTMIKS